MNIIERVYCIHHPNSIGGCIMDTIINTTATDNDVSNDIFDQYDQSVNTNTNNSTRRTSAIG
jgi:hypothetical protein